MMMRQVREVGVEWDFIEEMATQKSMGFMTNKSATSAITRQTRMGHVCYAIFSIKLF